MFGVQIGQTYYCIHPKNDSQGIFSEKMATTIPIFDQRRNNNCQDLVGPKYSLDEFTYKDLQHLITDTEKGNQVCL